MYDQNVEAIMLSVAAADPSCHCFVLSQKLITIWGQTTVTFFPAL